MLRRTNKSRHARVAIHVNCGDSTTISGGDFIHTCEPIGPAPEITCAGCNQKIAANEFAWQDTGENIGDFRRRLHQSIPIPIRFLLSRTFVTGCLAIALLSFVVDLFYDHAILFWLLVISLSSYVLGSIAAYFLVGCINFTDVE